MLSRLIYIHFKHYNMVAMPYIIDLYINFNCKSTSKLIN
jgi:hypothetical protein